MKIKKILGVCGAIFFSLGLIACTTNEGKEPIEEITKYVVTFNYKNGDPSTILQVQDGKKVAMPTEPQRDGYKFLGWYQDESLKKAWDFDHDTISENLTLYAGWEEIVKYSIFYYIQGHGEAPKDILETTNLPNPLPKVEDVEGWHFVGWYLEESFTTLAEAGKELTGNVTLYAKWEEVVDPTLESYSISFDMHGHGEAPEDILKTTNLPTPLPEIEDVQGWHFVGWYLDAECTTIAEAGKELTGNVILHAKWEEVIAPILEKYGISFDMHGHGEAPKNIIEATNLPNPLPEVNDVEGWHFVGWYLEESYTTVAEAGKELTGNVILHAKWEEVIDPILEKYSISFDMHGHGEALEDIIEATNLPNPLPEVNDVEGWHFIGWYLEENFTTVAEAEKELTGNVILHAKWEETIDPTIEMFSINYNINGKGEQPTNIKEALTLPEELPILSATGYVFAGWYLDSSFNNKATPSMQLTEDVNLFAKWVEENNFILDKAEGYLEGAYLEWKSFADCTDYNVYYRKASENDSSYKKIDQQLIREYPNQKYRADVLGLPAGNYVVKAVPVQNDQELNVSATESVAVVAHERSGFAFSQNSKFKTASGAYNDDGTLKSDAVVVYVTANNAKTVTCDLNINGVSTKLTGIQGILNGKQQANSTQPLCIRFLGLIKASDLDAMGSSSEGLQIKGKAAFSELNVTIEGVGEDTTLFGFGFLARNCGNVEFRNFAVMNQMDDSYTHIRANET
ncbi:MAG: InlB B-repeat-containing protein [Anaeroplasmataceae bacterium]|nr:InlB B-repeat-containing protein [Anaeroplasmataceae bacterium]